MSVPELLIVATLLLAIPALFRPKAPPTWEFRGLLAFLWSLNAAYCAIVHRLEIDPDPLPIHGPAILIANHTCNIDHCLLQAGTGRRLPFLIARKYYDVPFFQPFCRMIGCIPIDDGKFTAAARASLKALEDGHILAIFPEGRMTTTSGESFGEAKPGAAFIAFKAGVPVIPAYIRGTPRSNVVWKSFLTPSNARVIFGPPIEPGEMIPGEDHDEARARLTERFMAAIRALKDAEIR